MPRFLDFIESQFPVILQDLEQSESTAAKSYLSRDALGEPPSKSGIGCWRPWLSRDERWTNPRHPLLNLLSKDTLTEHRIAT